jgi:hypothetical protein
MHSTFAAVALVALKGRARPLKGRWRIHRHDLPFRPSISGMAWMSGLANLNKR